MGELPPDLIDLSEECEELFFGLDLDARAVVASEWFGHEDLDDSPLPEEAAAAEDEDDASDGSNEFDDPACLKGGGDAAAAAEPEGAAGGAAPDDAKPATGTGEISLDDLPRGCSLRDYAHQTIPGQSFCLARLPKGAPPFEGTKSKTHKYSNDDPAEQALAHAFCSAWLQRWSRSRGSGGGGSASSGGAAGAR